jgi:ubiquinone/menaquinone biosynthesis C-methylase UbiE
MPQFDYEKSIWGRGVASLSSADPTAFRLWRSLNWLKDLSAGSRVLEVGSGAGQFIRAFKKNRPDWDCFGSDISEAALEEARKANDGVVYGLSKDDVLPYPDNYFSVVLIFDVLEHVDNPEKVLAEIFRVLKPGGKFYCFVPCEGDKLSMWHWLKGFSGWKDLTQKYAGHINRWSRKAWLELFSRTGFKIKKINYSEHFFGQLLGLTAFYFINRAALRNGTKQINNEAFFSNLSSGNGWFSFFKNRINGLIYFESIIGRNIPSPNMHVLLEKSEYEK